MKRKILVGYVVLLPTEFYSRELAENITGYNRGEFYSPDAYVRHYLKENGYEPNEPFYVASLCEYSDDCNNQVLSGLEGYWVGYFYQYERIEEVAPVYNERVTEIFNDWVDYHSDEFVFPYAKKYFALKHNLDIFDCRADIVEELAKQYSAEEMFKFGVFAGIEYGDDDDTGYWYLDESKDLKRAEFMDHIPNWHDFYKWLREEEKELFYKWLRCEVK